MGDEEDAQTNMSNYTPLHETTYDKGEGEGEDFFSGISPSEVGRNNYLAFVAGDRFQMAIGSIIIINLFALWGETDSPDAFPWAALDHVFLDIFIVEIVLRLLYFTPAGYFCGKDAEWAILDTTLVCLGIIDLWMIPFLQLSHDGTASTTLQFLRLVRLLRLLRVFRMFNELHVFWKALVSMGEDFFWIFVVLFIVLFSCALILTCALGHAEAGGTLEFAVAEPEDFEIIRESFKDVWTSVFSLFQITTLDNWDIVAKPLIRMSTWWRLFFYAFITFSSWTMISVLTAVASNCMIEATSDRKEREAEEAEKNRKKFINFLHDTFLDADADGNGVLDQEEFIALMDKTIVHREMARLGIEFTPEWLRSAWNMLDIDGSGELKINDFVVGFSYLQEHLATKHFVSMEYSLKRISSHFSARMKKAQVQMSAVMKQNEEILHRLREQGRRQQQQRHNLWHWQQWAHKSSFNDYAQEQMPAEIRAAQQILLTKSSTNSLG